MASLDRARAYLEAHGEKAYASLYEKIKAVRLDNFNVVKTDDFSRLVVDVGCMDANDVKNRLEQKGVFCETVIGNCLIFITSPFNENNIGALADALNRVALNGSKRKGGGCPMPDARCGGGVGAGLTRPIGACPKNPSLEVQDAEFIDYRQSIGRVLALDICLFPPSVPIFQDGILITEQTVDYITKNRDKIIGLIGDKIRVVRQ